MADNAASGESARENGAAGEVTPMRVLVMGSGGLGGYYGWALGSHGHDVIFVARGAHLAAIREKGLTLRSLVTGETHVIKPASAVETPADAPPGPAFDLIIF